MADNNFTKYTVIVDKGGLSPTVASFSNRDDAMRYQLRSMNAGAKSTRIVKESRASNRRALPVCGRPMTSASLKKVTLADGSVGYRATYKPEECPLGSSYVNSRGKMTRRFYDEAMAAQARRDTKAFVDDMHHISKHVLPANLNYAEGKLWATHMNEYDVPGRDCPIGTKPTVTLVPMDKARADAAKKAAATRKKNVAKAPAKKTVKASTKAPSKTAKKTVKASTKKTVKASTKAPSKTAKKNVAKAPSKATKAPAKTTLKEVSMSRKKMPTKASKASSASARYYYPAKRY